MAGVYNDTTLIRWRNLWQMFTTWDAQSVLFIVHKYSISCHHKKK